ncbi:MAG: UDP-N-acetylglucosamine 1-carboxyvinyltransferase, partial [Chloroflexi bacterium]|nr:UDP-N-acetylglucosamine 1-carboxyvinyltransferase [Chloroflexota bacterium]
DELCKLGARITVSGSTATVAGPTALHGARVEGRDIRSAASLAMAALAAEGTTELHDAGHLQRGYERFQEKLADLGAEIVVMTPAALGG